MATVGLVGFYEFQNYSSWLRWEGQNASLYRISSKSVSSVKVRELKRRMHSFGSVECFSMLCKSCMIVTKWDSNIFMVGLLHSLDLVLNRMLNANLLFKFTMLSQTSCWLSPNSISIQRELWKAFQDFFILLIERKTLLCHFYRARLC